MTADTKSPSAREVAERIARDVLVGDREGDGIEDHVRRVESALLSFAQSARQEQREEDAKNIEAKACFHRRVIDLNIEAGETDCSPHVEIVRLLEGLANDVRGSK